MNNEQATFLEHDEFCVCLRFSGHDLDPEELTRLLGASPTEAYRRGDTVQVSRPPRPVSGGTWAIRTERSTHDIEVQLTDLFCGVFIAWFGHGFSMSPALHRTLADRQLVITFDIYPEYDRNA